MSMPYLLLAEGSSGDPLYGKTMRGMLRYRREDVVAILDSTRAGETEEGVPIVASVGEALPLGPTTALVGVVTQGGYFPLAWMELLRSCVEHGLDVENGLHVFLTDDPELRALAAERGVELRGEGGEPRIVAEEDVQPVLDVEPVLDAVAQQLEPRWREAAALRGDADEGRVRAERQPLLDGLHDADAVLRVPGLPRRVEDRRDVVAAVAEHAPHRLAVMRVGAEALSEDQVARA